jgi:hypothetical protein
LQRRRTACNDIAGTVQQARNIVAKKNTDCGKRTEVDSDIK